VNLERAVSSLELAVLVGPGLWVARARSLPFTIVKLRLEPLTGLPLEVEMTPAQTRALIAALGRALESTGGPQT
jgi:hypothetical protein